MVWLIKSPDMVVGQKATPGPMRLIRSQGLRVQSQNKEVGSLRTYDDDCRGGE